MEKVMASVTVAVGTVGSSQEIFVKAINYGHPLQLKLLFFLLVPPVKCLSFIV